MGRELNCENGKFGKFVAQRLVVGAKFLWQPCETPAPEEVDLAYASVGLLRDRIPASWPTGKTLVAGFTFRNLGDESQDKANQRIKWLRHESYAPGIYQQLARIYRENGLDREAAKISIVGQHLRRKGGGMPRPSRAWSWFLEYTVGYGYRIQRPLYIVLAWGLLGALFFYLAQRNNNIMVPVAGWKVAGINANKCTAAYPCFNPVTYSFELLFPVINLRQVNFWLPSAASGWWGKVLLLNVWLAVAAGWVLGVAIVAGIGHLFSQRD